MRYSTVVAFAGALALSVAAGAAQAQYQPDARGYGPRQYDYRYDYRPAPPQYGPDRFAHRHDYRPMPRGYGPDRFANRDRFRDQDRFYDPHGFYGQNRAPYGQGFAYRDRDGNANRGSGPGGPRGPQGNQQAQRDGAYLGIYVQPLDANLADALKLPNTSGALVSDVQANGPAANAGIKAGDVVVAFAGKAVNTPADLVQSLRAGQSSGQATVTIYRQGARQDVSVMLGGTPGNRAAQNQGGPNAPPAAPAPGTLGITVGPGPGPSGGVVVTGVNPNSPAERAGLQRGDRILAVGDRMVSSPGDVRGAVDALRQGGAKNVLLQIQSGSGTRFIAVQIG